MTGITKLHRRSSHLGQKCPAQVYLLSLAEGSRPATLSKLRKVAALIFSESAPRRLQDQTDRTDDPFLAMDWSRLRWEHVEAIRSYMLDEQYSPSTINATLSALREVAGRAFDLRQIDAEEYTRIKKIKSVSGSREAPGRMITRDELAAMYKTCHNDERPQGHRDLAIIALGIGTGMRRHELAGLSGKNIEFDQSGDLLVRFIGKGNRERTVGVYNTAAIALRAWLRVTNPDEYEPLFVKIDRWGNIKGGDRLSPAATGDVLVRRAKASGVSHLTSHDMRRTVGSTLFDSGVDLPMVQAILGHASPVTTSMYDRRPQRLKNEAIRNLRLLDDN